MASSPWSRRPCKRGKPWPVALYRVSTFKETRFEADLSRARPWPPGLYPSYLFFTFSTETKSGTCDHGEDEEEGAAWRVEVQ
ncbi:hypothetical protein B296_00043946 [Ensete ventricosum]|uniref:Uncharacterized protein n=1 Tax=Ensete ventricosum TaxID=4639 RepID=A0A426XW90_ENSVE|nr:hypothetical protein B296_00043946 [Ensete ventricosum]